MVVYWCCRFGAGRGPSGLLFTMSQMDAFLPLLTTHDIMKKLSVGADVIKHLESTSDIECEDIGLFIDSVLPWTTQSNFRVSY